VSAVVLALTVTMPAACAKAPKVRVAPLDVIAKVSTLLTPVKSKSANVLAVETDKMSVPVWPLITSVDVRLVAKTKVSFPLPPEILSSLEPAVIVSAPEPPVMVEPPFDNVIDKMPVNAEASTVLTAVSNAVSILRFWSPVILMVVAPPPVNC